MGFVERWNDWTSVLPKCPTWLGRVFQGISGNRWWNGGGERGKRKEPQGKGAKGVSGVINVQGLNWELGGDWGMRVTPDACGRLQVQRFHFC